MMSLGASGSIGNAITFSTWKGRPYARELVVPANPKSGLQTGFRSMFRFLSQQWINQSAADQATWDDLADQIVASPFNAFMRHNQRRWRNYKTPTQAYPALEAGTVATLSPSFDADTGVGSVLLSWTISVLADNWGIIIYRSPTGTFTPSLSNAVQIVLCDTAAAFSWLDTPLEVQTWYYNAALITNEGVMGTLEGECEADAT